MIEIIEQYSQWIPICYAVVTFLGFYVLRAILIHHLIRISKKTKNDVDDVVVNILKSINLAFAFVISVLVGLWVYGFNFTDNGFLSIIFIIILTYQVERAVQIIFEYAVNKVAQRNGGTNSVHGLKTIISILVWISGILLILATLGYNVTSIVAGLGIGGLAVALALQNILADIFSSFTIFFDKPFVVGDYIKVGETEGEVQKIGLKTTRMQSLRGEEIVISNRELTETRIQNFGKLDRRRVVINLGFAYDSSNKKLEELPDKSKKVVDSIKGLDFGWMRFKEFGSSALIYELIYHVNAGEYDVHVDTQHELHLKLKELFELMKIELAYPSQSIYVKK